MVVTFVIDNPPYCLRHRYRSVVAEDVDTGTFLLSVRASDVDEESHENFRFYLTGTGAEHFSLDKAGGHLRTAHILDRETQSKYLLTAHVQDRDGTTQGWECSSQVEILIADVNDNAPQFTLVSYTASLSEDAQVGTLVAKLHANDNDTGINRKVRYVIVEDDPAFLSKPQFKITSDSGIVTSAQPLDREEKDHYNLTVEASDQGTPQLKTRTHLYVKVLDVNDNPPEFVSKLYHAVVPELSPVDTTVVKVMATSKDIGVNAEISYSIVSGNGHKKFAIDSETGVLSIREPLDYEICRNYFLTIEAIDGEVLANAIEFQHKEGIWSDSEIFQAAEHLKPHSWWKGFCNTQAVAPIAIRILQQPSSAAPVERLWSNFGLVHTKLRNRLKNSTTKKLVTVRWNSLLSRRNSPSDKNKKRRTRETSESFYDATGYPLLQTEQNPNNESEEENEETDNSSIDSDLEEEEESLNDSADSHSVCDSLSDEDENGNDNAPIFNQPSYSARIREDSDIGGKILQVNLHVNLILIDNSSGYISVAKPLDREVLSSYVLEVEAVDGGIPPLSSIALLNVEISDVNDNAPVFSEKNYTAVVQVTILSNKKS
ncbi:cadherin-11-like [Frankliniella occidentalis]|uniref:Cadherin-11-like n=1 Tax=Frankliniella occidentalis TaxID=133901 RepID=A0A9C6X8K5_FRAOC|nr:cadherin-11-like [Frankliniella occidentalis]